MNILVAGAGHGGLSAALGLAKAGHTVTVLEQKQKDELGHDWEDRFTFSVLEEIAGKKIPEEASRVRGNCTFVSPDYQTEVKVLYDEEHKQRVMWRKPLLQMLTDACEKAGVQFVYGITVTEPVIQNGAVIGIKTDKEEITADLVIDSLGAFSALRQNLPNEFEIEKLPKSGDVFYAWRAYFNKTKPVEQEPPFEVYLCHEHEKGLSWCCVNPDSVDILIGRVEPINRELVNRHINGFRSRHPFMGDDIIHGGHYGVIPVRRALGLMVANGYAAVGDAAFMTTPMNGMGIDLSLQAGKLLADTVNREKQCGIEALWLYNRDFHRLYGAETARNEGLKNALITMPGEGVDFLFKNGVIQASDLAGAGRNTNPKTLMGKFVRGMKNPKYFFAVIGGLIKGGKTSKILKNAPEVYDRQKVSAWQKGLFNQ